MKISHLSTGTVEVPANGMVEPVVSRTDGGTFVGATLVVSGSSYVIATVAAFTSSQITVRLRSIGSTVVTPKVDIYLLYK